MRSRTPADRRFSARFSRDLALGTSAGTALDADAALSLLCGHSAASKADDFHRNRVGVDGRYAPSSNRQAAVERRLDPAAVPRVQALRFEACCSDLLDDHIA